MLTTLASTKILCLLAGQLYRLDPSYLRSISNQSTYLNVVSNRLASSSGRAKTLGMLFAMIISDMVDPEERRLRFEEVEDEYSYFKSITMNDASVGSIADLRSSRLQKSGQSSQLSTVRRQSNQETLPEKAARTKIMEIQEVTSSEDESEDDDLLVYAKPDSDVSDEEEDATMVQRNKPIAPV